MKEIQELIETALILSQNLEKAAAQERKFCVDLQLRFENLSWEMLRTANELNEIKEYIA